MIGTHRLTGRSGAVRTAKRLAALLLPLASQVHPLEAEATLGVGALGVRDDLLVPLVFSGPQVHLGGRIGWTGWHARQEFLLGGDIAYLTNSFGHEGISYGEELAWRADWPVFGPTGIGTGLISRSRVSYLWSWDDAHAYWIGSLAIPMAVSREIAWGDWTGFARMSIAVLTLESRPAPYYTTKQQPLKDPVFILDRQFFELGPTAPWNHLAIDLETTLYRNASPWGLGISAHLVRATAPAQAFALDAGLHVTRRWGGQE